MSTSTNTATNTGTSTGVETIDTYLQAYGEPDGDRRRELIERAFASDATLADPPFDAAGHEALHATFGAVLDQYPRHTFRRTSEVDEHHDAARYRWQMVGPDGAIAFAGTDVVRFDGTGKIASVLGFFDA
jgi:hypothetical protein